MCLTAPKTALPCALQSALCWMPGGAGVICLSPKKEGFCWQVEDEIDDCNVDVTETEDGMIIHGGIRCTVL